MSDQITWKDWLLTLGVVVFCFVGVPFALHAYTISVNERFKQDVQRFAPGIIVETRSLFDKPLQLIATTEYVPNEWGGGQYYGPKEETVQAQQPACKALAEAGMRANHQYYIDERDCGIFFQKGSEWTVVNGVISKPAEDIFYMENILKLQASHDPWRIDQFGDYYKVTYRLQTDPDAFVDIMIRRRAY